MNTVINLDKYINNTTLTLKGIDYTIPPVSYELSMKFLKVDRKTQMDVFLELLLEYLNTNIEGKKIDAEEIKKLLNMKQITALTQHIIEEIVEIEKN